MTLPTAMHKALRVVAVLVAAAVTIAPAKANPGSVLEALALLPVKAAEPMAGYSREQFGEAWADDNDDQYGHNDCDTRDDILARDLTDVVRRGNCMVISGTLHDPYTGKIIQFQRGPSTSTLVQIDHVVALGNAWITGAQELTPQQRVDLANDPRNLLAVDGAANNNKRDHNAAEWLPPDPGFHCTYVADQVTVKNLYHLWVTQPERDAMARVLASCPEGI